MAKIEELGKSRVKLEIEVSPEKFEEGLDYAFERIKDDVEIKGFRKGKVTRKVYEQHKGVEGLYEEALQHVIQQTYIDAVNEHELPVVSQPKIDLDVNKVEQGKPFTYTATVAIRPEVELGQYKGFTYEKPQVEIDEEELKKELDRLREQNAELVVKEEGTVEEGDTVVFDFEGFIDGEAFEGGKAENHELEIGSGSFIPGFEEKMAGMKAGEEKEIEVTFPEDYQAEHLAGKDAVFKVKLHEIKKKVVPELDDDFVKDLDRDGIETVDALKEDTKKSMEEQKEEANKNKAIDFAVGEASKNAEMEIADEMIQEEKNRMMDNTKRQAQQYGIDLDTYLQLTGMDKEAFEKKLSEDAEKSIRYNLTINAIAEKEDIEVSKEEIDKKVKALADQHNMDVEQVRSQVSDSAIEQEVIMRKTIDFLVDSLEMEESQTEGKEEETE